jgi:outer membrane protein assembly factor BamB
MRATRLVVVMLALMLFFQDGSLLSNADGKSFSIKEDSDCDWTSFTKNPEGNRIASAGCGPLEDKPQLLWSFATDARIWTTPVVANNLTYIRTDSNRLYCVDVRTGKQKWEAMLGVVESGTMRSSYSSACIFEGNVYIGSFDKKMYCLNATTGKKVWTLNTEGAIWSSPVIHDGKLYFGSSDKLVYCVNPKTGETLWTYKTGYNVSSSPTFMGEKMYIGSMDSRLYCLIKDNGSKVWDLFIGDKNQVESTPTVCNDKIFYGTRGGSALCIDPTRGIPQWIKKDMGEISRSMLVVKGKVYFCAGETGKTGKTKLYCLNESDGSKAWEMSYTNNKTGGSNVVSYGDKIVFTASDDKLYILDAAKGTEVWSYKIPDSSPNTYPVVIDKRILVSSYNNTLYCFGDGNAFEPSRAAKIKILTSTTKVDPCMTLKLSAQVFDQFDDPFTKADILWSVDDEKYGSIDEKGLFTPAQTGKVKITCQAGSVSESVDIEIMELLSFDRQLVMFENLEPQQQYIQPLTLSNIGDTDLEVSLDSDFDKVFINPPNIKIGSGKSEEVKLSYTTKDFKLGDRIDFKITATYGKCKKQVDGRITTISVIDCIKTDKTPLDFGFIKRGETKSSSVGFTSDKPVNATITCDVPWITVSKSNLQISNAVSRVDFSVTASSLPAQAKLTAKIIVKPDSSQCKVLEIPVTVETEPGIVLKLQLDSKTAYINDTAKTLDAPATIVKGRTVVPIRFVSDAFGCRIEWNKDEQKITILRYDMKILLWIGKNTAEVNGQQLKIDAPPVIIGGRTMVPLRFIAEPFGAQVNWNAQTKEITIIWPKP